MDHRLVLAARLGIAPYTEEPAPGTDRSLAAPEGELSAAWIREALELVTEHQRAARSDRVWPILRELEPRLGELDARDPASAAHITRALATQALVEGAIEAFLARAELAAEKLARAGDAASADERASWGAGLRMLGLWDEAERALRAAIVEGAGAAARIDLGRVHAARGALEEARAMLQEAIAGLDPTRDRALAGLARACLAEVRAAQGAHEEAEIEAHRAMDALGATRSGRARAGAALARARMAAGKNDEARAAAEQAVADLEACAAMDDGEALVRMTLADARLAAGDREGAARALAEARRRVLADASKLGDPRVRRAFLEAIPEHRRALSPAS
jgi:tetratricopeptide (TPR) repeat protein